MFILSIYLCLDEQEGHFVRLSPSGLRGKWPGHQRYRVRTENVAAAMGPRTKYGEAFEGLWRT